MFIKRVTSDGQTYSFYTVLEGVLARGATYACASWNHLLLLSLSDTLIVLGI
jgi:hypothetical protein